MQVYTEPSSALKAVPNEDQQTSKSVFQSYNYSYCQSTIINPFSDRERLIFQLSPRHLHTTAFSNVEAAIL